MKSTPFGFFSSRSLRGLLVAAIVVSTPSLVRPVRADQPGEQQSAQVRYRHAVEVFRQKDLDEARRLFLELWNESHSYFVAEMLTQVEYQSQHYAAAARYLQFAVANVPPTEKVEAMEDDKKALVELQARTARLTISVDQPSAEIVVDEESVGKSPLASEVYLDPGLHVVEVKLDGRTATKSVEVTAGAVTSVQLTVGRAKAESREGSSPNPASNQGWSTGKWIALGSGGVLTVAAAVIGTAYAVDAGSKQSDVERLRPQARAELGGNCPRNSQLSVCGALNQAALDRVSATHTARVAFVASGVFAVGTVVTLLLWPEHEKSTQARVVPTFDRTGGTLTLQGAF